MILMSEYCWRIRRQMDAGIVSDECLVAMDLGRGLYAVRLPGNEQPPTPQGPLFHPQNKGFFIIAPYGPIHLLG